MKSKNMTSIVIKPNNKQPFAKGNRPVDRQRQVADKMALEVVRRAHKDFGPVFERLSKE